MDSTSVVKQQKTKKSQKGSAKKIVSGSPRVSATENGKASQKTPVAASSLPLNNVIEPVDEIVVSETERSSAKEAFCCGSTATKKIYPRPKIPLPKSAGVRNILVTSALPYVNNVPHLGNLIGSTLSANVFALYCDLAGHNCLSICGTDEYGTATEAKAQAEGVTAREICDKYHILHCEIYNWFDIHFDKFGRTTNEKHIEIVQGIFREVWDNGFVLSETVEQLFCEQCFKFLADRFVEGTCPLCKYLDARGDQCDKCGRLMNAVELIEPRCKTCRSKPVIRSSQHLFLDLPKLEDKLTAFVNARANDQSSLWTPNARTITNTWLRDGLKPRCITRDLQWGVPVPQDGYRNKVFYVWFDAPIGYLSITASYSPDWRRWWQPSGAAVEGLTNGSATAAANGEEEAIAPVELFQFMAKDNVPFHAVMFPACLLAANVGHTLVKHVVSTEYMNYEDTKFSKSRQVGVFGNDAMKSGISSNIWRFYLLYRRPENQDSSFSWADFVLVNNNELSNNLGNFVNRSLTFMARFFDSTVPAMNDLLEPQDLDLLARVNQLIATYVGHLEACRLREGIRQVLAISRLGNVYLQTNQPWVAIKEEETKPRAGVVIGIVGNISCLLGALLHPYMPSVAKVIWSEQCQMSADRLTLQPMIGNSCRLHQLMPAGHRIGKHVPLFRKIEADEVARLSTQFSGMTMTDASAKPGVQPTGDKK